MQGWLLEEMNKFTKIGVATPKYQIQNNFPNKKFSFKNWPQKPPKSSSLQWIKLLKQADKKKKKNPVSFNWHFSSYNTENTKSQVHKQNAKIFNSNTEYLNRK